MICKKLNKENVNSFLKGYNYRYCGYSGRFEHQVAPIAVADLSNSLFFKSYDEIDRFFYMWQRSVTGSKRKAGYNRGNNGSKKVSHNKECPLQRTVLSEAFSVLAQLEQR